MTRLFRGLCVIFAAVLAGCSPGGTLRVLQPLSAPIPDGRTTSLSVEAVGDSIREDQREVARRLKTRLFGELVAEGVFKQVLQVGEVADYTMTIKVTAANVVSGAARAVFATWAGRNDMRLFVELRDRAGQVAAQFEIQSESGSLAYGGGNDIEDALREAGRRVVQALKRKND